MIESMHESYDAGELKESSTSSKIIVSYVGFFSNMLTSDEAFLILRSHKNFDLFNSNITNLFLNFKPRCFTKLKNLLITIFYNLSQLSNGNAVQLPKIIPKLLEILQDDPNIEIKINSIKLLKEIVLLKLVVEDSLNLVKQTTTKLIKNKNKFIQSTARSIIDEL